MLELLNNTEEMASAARAASLTLARATPAVKNSWLAALETTLRSGGEELQAANARDLEAAPAYGLSAAAIDRLRLTDERVESLALAVAQIIALPDPVGEILDGSVRPGGLRVERVRVPLGVVFFIYESRPNVTIDAAALCVKSGNAVILRGGKEAAFTNKALHRLVVKTLTDSGLPPDSVQFVDSPDRSLVGEFLSRDDLIDVVIPRGGKGLIERVAREARMPVIKHLDGVCHVYVDAAADHQMATDITVNAKAQRPGVCNAAETLLVHQAIAESFLPQVAAALRAEQVELRGCAISRSIVGGMTVAEEEDWRTEYLDRILSVKVVETIDEAIAHINKYGSRHTDAIITRDITAAEQFTAGVDAAAVVVNASTRFNDGGELGLGAEIGISTDKLHARGPCGLRELTSYKWIIRGTGHVRQ